jgi:hypothetical protein
MAMLSFVIAFARSIGVAGPASAENLDQLTDEQMDKVTGGVFTTFGDFGLTGTAASRASRSTPTNFDSTDQQAVIEFLKQL